MRRRTSLHGTLIGLEITSFGQGSTLMLLHGYMPDKNQCICISDWYVQASHGDYAPQVWCNSECNGDGGRCGGQKVYTQYSRCHGKACPVDFNLEFNCAYVDLSGTIKAASCEEQHFHVCVIGKGSIGFTFISSSGS
ncbi:uncharacterized protein LOC117343772 [Pecten maximus]|uniref:uncharacterized protein LOC117343772 n=1 Tax=Pecten maximus TaxID=6579 RepID=UPI001458014C|nr:uncharacterized protein LOC117343772 [Pecten maximus]